MKDRIETLLATVFGGIFLGLAVVVAVETISRKLFNVSLQGADELGGYALAVGSTIAFSLALMGRNHIRVDVFHDKFSRGLQAALNWLSIVTLAAFAVFIAWIELQPGGSAGFHPSVFAGRPAVWTSAILEWLVLVAVIAWFFVVGACRKKTGGPLS